mmetsp:Transcript_15120/g.32820  ORF Transcript_15120/g.32820 Transcript_15120/m.32820 type:complete len:604 (+) Transcript_15120:103-1914(+)
MNFAEINAHRKEQRRQFNRHSAAASRERVNDRISELERDISQWKDKVQESLDTLRTIGGEEGFVEAFETELNTTPKCRDKDPHTLIEITSIMMKTSPKKSSRESEIALLDQLSTRLDSYTGLPSPHPRPACQLQKKRLKAFENTSKNVSTNILMVKTLVKGMIKACVQEELAITNNGKQSVGVIDALVEEYRYKYPSLTRTMVTDGIARHNKSLENSSDESDGKVGGANTEDNGDLKLGRCIEIVEEHLESYFDKIEALKKRRSLSSAASEPDTAPTPSKKRKSTGEGDASATSPPKKKRGRPRKDTPENALVAEITERYLKEREKSDRLPNGRFEAIVEETKKDFGMEDSDLSLAKIRKRVTYYQMNRPNKVERESSQSKTKKELIEKVYERYARAEIANEGKLAPGTLKSIVEGAKLELGIADVKMTSFEAKIQTRFKKEHPELFDSSVLSEDDKLRRQNLMNEVSARYARAKEEHPKKNLPHGKLDVIIDQTKADMGMHEFDVPKVSIRGRIGRDSLHVMTMGSNSPYDAIDEPLVETINNWLSQGISVTRAQGLEFANTLLEGKKMDCPDGISLLDAKWWRNFLDRNKHKLACTSSDEV